MSTARALLLPAACLAALLAAGAGVVWSRVPMPETADITGISGAAGEWEVTAKLTRVAGTRELAGDMRMKHTGWCIQDGPQERSGAMRLRLARLGSSMDGSVTVDGIACSYSATLTDAWEGRLACPDRRPVMMLLWVR